MSHPDGENFKTVRFTRPETIDDRPILKPSQRGGMPSAVKPHERLSARLTKLEGKVKKLKTKMVTAEPDSPPPVAPVRDQSPPRKSMFNPADPLPLKSMFGRAGGRGDANLTYSKKGLKFTVQNDHPANLNVWLGEENIQWSGQYDAIGFIFATTFMARSVPAIDKIEKRLLKAGYRKTAK